MGCQLVALNYQTNDNYLRWNRAFFKNNGSSGYIVRPKILFNEPSLLTGHTLHLSLSDVLEHQVFEFRIRVISGRYLECLKPVVEVAINGIPQDCQKFQTAPADNGFHCHFDVQLTFFVYLSSLAVLTVTILDSTCNERKELAYFCGALETISMGYRILPLFKHKLQSNKKKGRGDLLCHFSCSPVQARHINEYIVQQIIHHQPLDEVDRLVRSPKFSFEDDESNILKRLEQTISLQKGALLKYRISFSSARKKLRKLLQRAIIVTAQLDVSRTMKMLPSDIAIMSSFMDVHMLATEDNTSLFHMACEENAVQLCDRLLALGADVNASNHLGMTGLHFACMSCALDVVARLLDVPHVWIAAPNQSGAVALHYLVRKIPSLNERLKYVHTMCALLGRMTEEEINLCNSAGENALHYAVSRSNTVAVKVLLQFGCDPHHASQQYGTPFDVCRKRGDVAKGVLSVLHEFCRDEKITRIRSTPVLFETDRMTETANPFFKQVFSADSRALQVSEQRGQSKPVGKSASSSAPSLGRSILLGAQRRGDSATNAGRMQLNEPLLSNRSLPDVYDLFRELKN